MQGYITIALDQNKYVDMAANLARSLKYFDPDRPRCLVYNDKVTISDDVASAFDHLVKMEPRNGFLGCMNKVLLDELSPYDETMYVDADCLLVKNDIDRHWQRLSPFYFNMTGEKRTQGMWNSLDIAKACERLSLPYVVQMNSGVFYFKKGAHTSTFFSAVRELFRDHRDFISNIHQGRAGQYADEPFFGAAMGMFKIEPLGGSAQQGSWMVTTWHARNCMFDPQSGISRIDKPKSYWFGVRLLPREWVQHSPTIAHFISLKPRDEYEKTADYFRIASGDRPKVPVDHS